MTHEVWFAMLGLNLDLWSHSLVDKAVSEFGKLIVWEEDHDNMARVLVKARVISLDAIPWFFTFAEGDDPEANSWTVECEVFHASLLGVVAQDEDMPSDDDDDVQPNHFDFYGFGQPGRDLPISLLKNLMLGRMMLIHRALVGMLGPILKTHLLKPNSQKLEATDDVAPQLIPVPQEPIKEVINDKNMAALEGLIEIVDANQPGQVLAMDDQTDDSEGDALPPPLFQVDPIEIVPSLISMTCSL